jgi:pilus assembly protein CpaB
MNRRIVVVAVVAVVLALLAAFGAYRYLSEKTRFAEKARLETVGIVVAAVDIPLGAKLTPSQVAISAWPKDQYPKDAISDAKAVVGRMAIRDFFRGEPIVGSKLVPADKSAGILSLKIPVGMRAYSVKVNEVVGVGGFIVPDTRVDVIVTTAQSAQHQPGKVSKIVLEDVRVLAVGQSIEVKDSKPTSVNTVTLAVTPEDAEKLALASNDGTIQLVMRNFADTEKVMTGGADKGGLLSSYRNAHIVQAATPAKEGKPRRASGKAPASAPSATSPAPRRSYTIEVIRGNKRTEESVD